MQIRRLTLLSTLTLAALIAPGCAPGGGGGGGGGGDFTIVNVSEAEPNNSEVDADDLGDVYPMLELRVSGASGPSDVDLFEIYSNDYLNASFELTPPVPGCDLDLIIYDLIYFNIVVERFESSSPNGEFGSFELQPGNHYLLEVRSYGTPTTVCAGTTYDFDLRFSPASSQGGSAPTPPLTPVADVTWVEGTDETFVLMRSNDPRLDELWMRELKRTVAGPAR